MANLLYQIDRVTADGLHLLSKGHSPSPGDFLACSSNNAAQPCAYLVESIDLVGDNEFKVHCKLVSGHPQLPFTKMQTLTPEAFFNQVMSQKSGQQPALMHPFGPIQLDLNRLGQIVWMAPNPNQYHLELLATFSKNQPLLIVDPVGMDFGALYPQIINPSQLPFVLGEDISYSDWTSWMVEGLPEMIQADCLAFLYSILPNDGSPWIQPQSLISHPNWQGFIYGQALAQKMQSVLPFLAQQPVDKMPWFRSGGSLLFDLTHLNSSLLPLGYTASLNRMLQFANNQSYQVVLIAPEVCEAGVQNFLKHTPHRSFLLSKRPMPWQAMAHDTLQIQPGPLGDEFLLKGQITYNLSLAFTNQAKSIEPLQIDEAPITEEPVKAEVPVKLSEAEAMKLALAQLEITEPKVTEAEIDDIIANSAFLPDDDDDTPELIVETEAVSTPEPTMETTEQAFEVDSLLEQLSPKQELELTAPEQPLEVLLFDDSFGQLEQTSPDISGLFNKTEAPIEAATETNNDSFDLESLLNEVKDEQLQSQKALEEKFAKPKVADETVLDVLSTLETQSQELDNKPLLQSALDEVVPLSFEEIEQAQEFGHYGLDFGTTEANKTDDAEEEGPHFELLSSDLDLDTIFEHTTEEMKLLDPTWRGAMEANSEFEIQDLMPTETTPQEAILLDAGRVVDVEQPPIINNLPTEEMDLNFSIEPDALNLVDFDLPPLASQEHSLEIENQAEAEPHFELHGTLDIDPLEVGLTEEENPIFEAISEAGSEDDMSLDKMAETLDVQFIQPNKPELMGGFDFDLGSLADGLELSPAELDTPSLLGNRPQEDGFLIANDDYPHQDTLLGDASETASLHSAEPDTHKSWVESAQFEAGQTVEHPLYGKGQIKKVIKMVGDQLILNIEFEQYGKRLLDPELCDLKRLSPTA